MISDQITLGSSSAYLLNPNDQPNLGGASPSTARTPKLAPNQIWDVSGLELLIEGDDLTSLLHLPDTLDTPLMEMQIQKEVYPSLYTNPFATRAHNVAGFDDFERGQSMDCFVTEVNKIPTLVSRNSDYCEWKSVVYKLPAGIDIYAASWELATSRLVHEKQFKYSIKLLIWRDHNTDRTADAEFELANETDADDARTWRFNPNPNDPNPQPNDCHAFQLLFTATVEVDSTFYQSHRVELTDEQGSAVAGGTIGTPLLRSIRLLERVESSYRYYSLNELIQEASFYQMFDPQGSNLNRLILSLDYSAVLVGKKDMENAGGDDYEYFELAVTSDAFSRVQAKLLINERLRIPPNDKD